MSDTIALPEDTPYDGVPYVGCAATRPSGSDCYPATVTWVSDKKVEVQTKSGVVRVPKTIRIQENDYRGVPGHVNSFTEDQRYLYFEDSRRSETEYSWREKRSGYIRVGDSSRNSQRLSLGSRRMYRDPCF